MGTKDTKDMEETKDIITENIDEPDITKEEPPAEQNIEDSGEPSSGCVPDDEGGKTKDGEASDDSPSLKKKKKEKKDKRDELIEELNDKVKRQLAEFENFRNRTEKEKSSMFDMGARTIIEKILPVIDNFERGLATKPDSGEAKAFADGMEMVYKQLLTGLKEAGMEEIEAVGKEFNPDIHNAVMQVEDEDKASGTVADELQKGYTYHGTVVRHSMVSVVQ